MDSLRFSFATTNVSFSAGSITARKKTPDYDGSRLRMTFRVLCSKNKRGFGPNSTKKKNSTRKIPKESTRNLKPDIPGLNTGFDDKLEMMVSEREFQEKLEVVRRSTLAQKKAKEEIYTQAIDYDTPIERDESTVGLGTKVGIGIAVVVFGTVFAFGDFLPSSRVNTNEDAQLIEKKLTDEEKSTLQSRLQGFQTILAESPDDLSAVEGSAVTLVELGEYRKASDLLEKLTKERPEDSEAYRLLGEVKYQLKDYVSSAESYKKSLGSGTTTLEALRGVTNALLAAKKPEEAVQVLLSYAEDHASASRDDPSASKGKQKYEQNVDPIQVRLLLGKAYSDWGHVSDAVAVYDQLIFEHPNDFRGYLAKGIILKENGKAGDAERMFIQARFFAPEKAKQLVDQYARK